MRIYKIKRNGKTEKIWPDIEHVCSIQNNESLRKVHPPGFAPRSGELETYTRSSLAAARGSNPDFNSEQKKYR